MFDGLSRFRKAVKAADALYSGGTGQTCVVEAPRPVVDQFIRHMVIKSLAGVERPIAFGLTWPEAVEIVGKARRQIIVNDGPDADKDSYFISATFRVAEEV